MSAASRLRTLVKQIGPCRAIADSLPTPAYRALVEAKRVMTIHHGERADDMLYGEPGHHVCNVIERVTFDQPIPSHIRTVIGIRFDLICR